MKTVSKVMDARERDPQEKENQRDQYEYVEMDVEIEEDDEDWNKYIDDDDNDTSVRDTPTMEEKEVVVFDDFSALASADTDTFFSLNSIEASESPDPAVCRQQRASEWDDVAGTNEATEKKEKRTRIIKKLVKRKVEQPEIIRSLQRPGYRLASLFGDVIIPYGTHNFLV